MAWSLRLRKSCPKLRHKAQLTAHGAKSVDQTATRRRTSLASFGGSRKGHMRQTFLAAIALPAAASVVAPSSLNAQSQHRGADYFPNLPVVTQDGKTLKFYDDVIKDKIVLISFIYTNCPDICPLTTARIAQVEDELGEMVGRDVFFISMTVDPERDTPERLKEFATAFDAGPGWLFLTGKLEDIRAINYKLGDRSDRGLSDHRNEIVLGNEPGGYWQRASVFGDLDSLVISIRQMNPVWLSEVHLPQREELDVKRYIISDDRAGQILFKKICAPCHTIGVGDRVGPDLRDVIARRDRAWLMNFIRNPKKMFADKDPIVLALAEKFPGVRMPVLGISDSDTEELLSYLDEQSARIVDTAPGSAPRASQANRQRQQN